MPSESTTSADQHSEDGISSDEAKKPNGFDVDVLLSRKRKNGRTAKLHRSPGWR